MSRYFVEKDATCETECDCPPALCTHPNGVRFYTVWNVVDVESGDPVAWYNRRRDAKAEADELNAMGGAR